MISKINIKLKYQIDYYNIKYGIDEYFGDQFNNLVEINITKLQLYTLSYNVIRYGLLNICVLYTIKKI